MSLNKQQRQRLETYRLFHQRPPRPVDLLKRVAPQLVAFLLLALFSLVAAVVQTGFFATFWFIFFGAVLGATAAVLVHLFVSLRVWPLIEQITDWNHVDELHRAMSPDETSLTH